MSARAVPPIVLFALATGGFVYALLALARHEDLYAVLALGGAALALHALRRSIQLLEGP